MAPLAAGQSTEADGTTTIWIASDDIHLRLKVEHTPEMADTVTSGTLTNFSTGHTSQVDAREIPTLLAAFLDSLAD